MRFRSAEGVTLSDNGRTAALVARPDRGDPEGVVVTTDGAATVTVRRGTAPAVSSDGRWAAFRVVPTLADAEAARRRRRDAPPSGLAFVDVTARRSAFEVPHVKAFAFAAGARHFVYHYGGAERDTARMDTALLRPRRDSLQRVAPAPRRTLGTRLVVRALPSGKESMLLYTAEGWALSEDGRSLAFSVASRDTTQDALYVRTLATGETVRLHGAPGTAYRHLTWSKTGRLAFLAAPLRADGTPGAARLYTWDGRGEARPGPAPDVGWTIPAGNRLAWTDDGARLFFGHRPDVPERAKPDSAFAGLDVDAILAGRAVDVWHGDDGRIQPQQKRRWADEQQRVWLSVLHGDGRAVRLDSADVLLAEVPQNPTMALQTASERYAREVSWDGAYADVFAVDLATGRRTRLASHARGPARLSPEGRWALFFDGAHWTASDTRTGAARRLTGALAHPLADEEHDTPDAAPAYGFGGFVDGGRAGDGSETGAAALVYDRYDVWRLDLETGAATNVTAGAGRAAKVRYRIVPPAAGRRAFAPQDTLLLTAFDETTKAQGLAAVPLARPGAPAWRVRADAFVRVARRAEAAPLVLVTQETHRDFPDLYALSGTGTNAGALRRLTRLNPQADSLRWGTSELVAWRGLDGEALEGVVLKPEGFDPARRYPVVVYFYERMADRRYQFNVPAVSHRPALAQYVGDGYLVFLPDVQYTTGQPGRSALSSLVPGVNRLVELGWADPARIGVQGHSWGGYQAAWLATQTRAFRAIVAGAPVANMTSAYGGVRWETGLSRQFQYERTQSRLGRTLWEARDRYVDNSPLFFADRMDTPLLLLHGDEDGAVPWEQSIEYYLALRRLGKPVIFLQYRGEGHHPALYANKLDWAMRMKQFFDAHLLGAPAPAWMTEGEPYPGR